MEACKMCWKTKEISPVFSAFPRAVEFCKGCAFDIHRVVNALAYALDTSGFAISLIRRNLILLNLETPGQRFIDLLTGEVVDELPPSDLPTLEREEVRVFQEVVTQGRVEGGSPEGGLEEGRVLQDPPDPLPSTPETRAEPNSHRTPRRSK